MRSLDNVHLQVLGMLLGKGEQGLLNRVFRRERELVTYIDCSMWNPGVLGLCWITYQCDHEDYEKVEQALLAFWNELSEADFPQKAIDRVKRQILVGDINSRKTFAGQASRIAMNEYLFGGQGFSKTFYQELENVTPESLMHMVRSYLIHGFANLVSITPKTEEKASIAPTKAAWKMLKFVKKLYRMGYMSC